MNPLRPWVLLAALAFGASAAYVGLFFVGIAIGWNHTAKRPRPAVTIRYVDRVAPRSNAPTPPSAPPAQTADAMP